MAKKNSVIRQIYFTIINDKKMCDITYIPVFDINDGRTVGE